MVYQNWLLQCRLDMAIDAIYALHTAYQSTPLAHRLTSIYIVHHLCAAQKRPVVNISADLAISAPPDGVFAHGFPRIVGVTT